MCYSFLLFFFFKQKTAYEMRISDWSSDVCSSDLRRPLTVSPHPSTALSALLLDLRQKRLWLKAAQFPNDENPDAYAARQSEHLIPALRHNPHPPAPVRDRSGH